MSNQTLFLSATSQQYPFLKCVRLKRLVFVTSGIYIYCIYIIVLSRDREMLLWDQNPSVSTRCRFLKTDAAFTLVHIALWPAYRSNHTSWALSFLFLLPSNLSIYTHTHADTQSHISTLPICWQFILCVVKISKGICRLRLMAIVYTLTAGDGTAAHGPVDPFF